MPSPGCMRSQPLLWPSEHRARGRVCQWMLPWREWGVFTSAGSTAGALLHACGHDVQVRGVSLRCLPGSACGCCGAYGLKCGLFSTGWRGPLAGSRSSCAVLLALSACLRAAQDPEPVGWLDHLLSKEGCRCAGLPRTPYRLGSTCMPGSECIWPSCAAGADSGSAACMRAGLECWRCCARREAALVRPGRRGCTVVAGVAGRLCRLAGEALRGAAAERGVSGSGQ